MLGSCTTTNTQSNMEAYNTITNSIALGISNCSANSSSNFFPKPSTNKKANIWPEFWTHENAHIFSLNDSFRGA
jgi:hypothetical protein